MANEDLISATCRLWGMWCHCRKGVGYCRPNARFRRGLKRRSSCLMHAYHGVCKSPYLHNHNMHAFDTALPTKIVLHISCMNTLCTIGRQILLTMFATNDVENSLRLESPAQYVHIKRHSPCCVWMLSFILYTKLYEGSSTHAIS